MKKTNQNTALHNSSVYMFFPISYFPLYFISFASFLSFWSSYTIFLSFLWHLISLRSYEYNTFFRQNSARTYVICYLNVLAQWTWTPLTLMSRVPSGDNVRITPQEHSLCNFVIDWLLNELLSSFDICRYTCTVVIGTYNQASPFKIGLNFGQLAAKALRTTEHISILFTYVQTILNVLC
jgi:hypothetical protein